ncbi:MAG: hypothetical protein K2X27_00955 [Candidatus Obscuribacterales bacterium]|nr:hypothetical protein [Candidatus Obscuribacterales bacterium]
MRALSQTRKQKGQAIAESAAGLVLITAVLVPLIMMLVNIYNVMIFKSKLEMVAAEAAKVYEGNEWFLGMRRQDFNSGKTTEVAQNIADSLCLELGLPELNGPASFEEKTTADGSSYIVCTLDANMGLPYVNKLFPSFLKLEAKGVSAGEGMAVHPPAVVNFSARSTTTGRKIGCQLPAYALYTDENRPLGNCSAPGAIKMPYSYTGYALGDNTVPMLENAAAGDAQIWSLVPNADPSQPPVPTRSVQ